MSSTPKDHPRYQSLLLRDRIIEGIERGFTSKQGLVAHGRGEAFDYLLGEKTTAIASESARVAAASLLLAKNPVISVNGNVAALCPDEVREISEFIEAKVEINLYHRTDERIKQMKDQLQRHNINTPIGLEPDVHIEGLGHNRGLATKGGIIDSDVVLVPLEDGDRTQVLRNMKKTVITIDLNPLSRTAQTATISIIDNVIRAIPEISKHAVELKGKPANELLEIINLYDNKQALRLSIDAMKENLEKALGDSF